MNLLAWGLGPQELIVIGVVAVLIFGRRLPEVGRNLGKGLLEFKHSLKGARNDLNSVGDATRDVSDAVAEADESSENTDRGPEDQPV